MRFLLFCDLNARTTTWRREVFCLPISGNEKLEPDVVTVKCGEMVQSGQPSSYEKRATSPALQWLSLVKLFLAMPEWTINSNLQMLMCNRIWAAVKKYCTNNVRRYRFKFNWNTPTFFPSYLKLWNFFVTVWRGLYGSWKWSFSKFGDILHNCCRSQNFF